MKDKTDDWDWEQGAKASPVATQAKLEMLRESLEDCVAVIRGALSGPVQVASVLKKADSVLYSTSESKKGN